MLSLASILIDTQSSEFIMATDENEFHPMNCIDFSASDEEKQFGFVELSKHFLDPVVEIRPVSTRNNSIMSRRSSIISIAPRRSSIRLQNAPLFSQEVINRFQRVTSTLHDPPRHFWTTEEEADLIRLVGIHTHKVGIVYRIDWISINVKLKYLNMTKSALAGKWKRYQRRLGRKGECKATNSSVFKLVNTQKAWTEVEITELNRLVSYYTSPNSFDGNSSNSGNEKASSRIDWSFIQAHMVDRTLSKEQCRAKWRAVNGRR